MATAVEMDEVSSSLPSLMKRVQAGEELTITEHGQPIARLVPIENVAIERGYGQFRGQIVMSDDFNAPLTEEELNEWETCGFFWTRTP